MPTPRRTGRGRAADDPPDDEPAARKGRAPSSCGLTVLIDASVKEIEVDTELGRLCHHPAAA